MKPPAIWWCNMAEFKWGKQRIAFEAHGRDVVLCETQAQAVAAATSTATMTFAARCAIDSVSAVQPWCRTFWPHCNSTKTHSSGA